jgi:methionine transaminase
MSKLAQTGTSIFSVMSAMASQHRAINLSQGFPNFPVDDRLTDILQKIAIDSVHQYVPVAGYPPLLEKISGLIARAYGRKVDTHRELLITAGATQGLFAIIQALANTGDEVVMLDPCYDSYEPSTILAGAKPVHVALNDDFTPDWDRIDAAVNERSRILIVNNPHNPSGRILNGQDFIRLENVMSRFPRLILLSDEVYEFITFEQPHISAHQRETLRDRCVVVSSFGKTFHITGWKTGYVIAPQPLMDEIKKVHQFMVFCVNSVAQAALSEYLDQVDVTQLGPFYQKKRDLFRNLIKDSRLELLPCEGSYFQVARYGAISQETDVDFCQRLVVEHGVAAIPISVFNTDGRDRQMIRFCFAKDADTLTQAAERLCRI